MTAIVDSDLMMYKAVTNDASASNGGRQSTIEVPNNTPRAFFPDLDAAQLAAGVTRWHKLFTQIETAGAGVEAESMGVMLRTPLLGDAKVYLAKGTYTDIQGDLSSPDLYGAGTLDAGVSAGATSIDVAVEDGTVPIFRDGEDIQIDDGVNREFVTISGTPVVAVDVVTITLATGLVHSYDAGSFVRSIADYANIAAKSENFAVITSGSLALNDALVVTDALGTVYQNWNGTFTSASAFDLDGDTLGAGLSSGNTLTPFAPINPDTGTPYFTIPIGAWSGTPEIGDTFSLRTVPASLASWLKLVVPPGTVAVGGAAAWLRYRFNTSL